MTCWFAPASQAADASIFNVTTPSRVAVHDPSIVIGYVHGDKITGEKGGEKVYYIFGSHRDFARSTDLQNWTKITNNINTDYRTIFANDASWASRGTTGTYDVTGNLWAPDVIWNPTMQKWCMYMSVNGDNWYSSIVLLTAESLDGDWTRVGTVVYSGFVTTDQARQTDFFKVHTSDATLPSRYVNGGGRYTLNAIDPCAFFDNDGNLWMTYGSWFGGLYILRLDKNTGLRDYTYTYQTTDGTAAGATSDEYIGKKLAGGNGVSGEASYIEYIGDRYYLFCTYGGLTSDGGYNMRVYSSEDVLGPYKDLSGQAAIYSTSNTAVGNVSGLVGTQLMNYYKWSLLSYGYVAEGHNSAVVDDDGQAYLVYHTRSTSWGEGHEVRVHQLFQAANGGLVTSPFEYRGEKFDNHNYTADEVAGTYKVIYHSSTNYASKVCNTENTLTLNADGTLSGAYTGTWKLTDGAGIQIYSRRLGTLDGVLVKQKMEGLNYENLCFTVVSKTSDIPLWGYKSVDDVISEAAEGTSVMPISDESVLANFNTGSDFNNATANGKISAETGLSLSFYCTGLTTDWEKIAQSTDGKYILYLSVMHYNSSDMYEAKATVSDEAAALGYTSANVWGAFLNGNYYVTVSYNPDGSIAYYRDGVLMLTYLPDTTPSWNDSSVSGSATVTPREAVAAVVKYYLNNQLDFIYNVYAVKVGYSVPYVLAGIEQIGSDATAESSAVYNLQGQRAGKDYKGLVIRNGKIMMQK
jgi:arabinan endo-1,5-alpha-L-arabinosidase